MDNFKNSHIRTLTEIEKITEQLSPEVYTQPAEILSGSTIGQHIRHIIEFYVCLFSQSEYVDYDERERNGLIENSPAYTLATVRELKEKLKALDLTKHLVFKQNIQGEDFLFPTSYARELIYLSEHSIHHFALIKIGIKALCPELVLDKNFGVAYSTIQYKAKKQTEECAF